MESSDSKEKKSGLSESFIIGVIAIVFLVVGYQTALFIHQASVMKIAANRDEPDTVYVYVPKYAAVPDLPYGQKGPDGPETPDGPEGPGREKSEALVVEKRMAVHSPRAEAVRENATSGNVESFVFNPNTVSVEDLCRLGFTPKQASAIDNYRQKGGRFRRKEDFAKSYVVADSVYRRLEAYIDIPLTDLNVADSAAFDALPGIGGWFASKMVEHREALGGYSYKEQLMDIKNFDQEKFDALKDLIIVSKSSVKSFALWALPADSLRKHPYIKNYETARSIVLFRENNPKENWTVENLGAAGILPPDQVSKLSRCIIADPTL